MSEQTTFDWTMIVQAFALLGYKFTPPEVLANEPALVHTMAWQVFLMDYQRCALECAWKGGNACLADPCPRSVLRRVSMQALPLTGLDPSLKAVADALCIKRVVE